MLVKSEVEAVCNCEVGLAFVGQLKLMIQMKHVMLVTHSSQVGAIERILKLLRVKMGEWKERQAQEKLDALQSKEVLKAAEPAKAHAVRSFCPASHFGTSCAIICI